MQQGYGKWPAACCGYLPPGRSDAGLAPDRTGMSRAVTIKLVVLYPPPGDPDAFDEHYLATHMPLVQAIPGLQRAESGRIVTFLDGGEATYYRVAELYFADQQALEAALGSDEGKATAADYQQIAPPGSRMFIQTLDD
jgi:uncharacterized protein (TIGR02118 family)